MIADFAVAKQWGQGRSKYLGLFILAREAGTSWLLLSIEYWLIKLERHQQGQGMLREGRVDERLLPLQGLNCTTAWFSAIVETRLHDLRIELGPRMLQGSAAAVIAWSVLRFFAG